MKVDITSTTLEKGFDLAKSFLDKIVGPPLEEIGLLLKEKVTLWRFKNQINVVNKAREYCLKHNIVPQEISLKILAPLMENASLEEDETLQEKWAMLLANMADSEQNIQNHVFPYLLSQISKNEFQALESAWLSKQERATLKKKELEDFYTTNGDRITELKNQIGSLSESVRERYILTNELRGLESKEKVIIQSIYKFQVVDDTVLEEFEISNLIRLGTVKTKVDHEVYAEPIRIPAVYEYQPETTLDINVGIEPGYDYHILTELGELFIKACSEKK